MTERIIALIDMDCFYCQVEARLNPSLMGKPMAVVQYNTWKGGGIIAVNYEARDFAVTRHLRGNEAKEKCPEIVLVQVPEVRGKADLTKYRDAGREVVNVLSQFSNCVERASVDEAYIDLTRSVEERLEAMDKPVTPEQLPNTFVVGFSEESNNDEKQRSEGIRTWLSQQMRDLSHSKLAVAGVIVEEMRAAVYNQTGFRCSAGIGHNKVLGKLVCGLHKPNRQTILPHLGVAELYRNMPVQKVRHLGGKLGESVVELLGCKVMADLAPFSEAELQAKFDMKNGSWLYNIARGIDHDLVTPRLLAKSIGCCKAFRGTQVLTSRTAIEKWTLDLAQELAERLVKDQYENKRCAKLLTVSFILEDTSSTRSCQFNSYTAERITADAIELIKKSNGDQWTIPIKYLGLSAGKFVDETSNQNSIQNFFKSVDKTIVVATGDKPKLNSDSVRPKLKEKPCEPNSFFLQYFKKQNRDSEIDLDLNTQTNDINFNKASCSKTQSNEYEDEFKSKPAHEEEQLKPLKPVLHGQNSSSSGSVSFISLSEIFPDMNAIDNDVAALLPSPMQRELDARRVSTQNFNGDVNGDSKVSSRTELFHISDTDNEVKEGISHVSDNDPFHLDDSTDVDDDLLPAGSNKSSTVINNNASCTSLAPVNEDSSSSLPKVVHIVGELCPKCSKHITLNEFAEHSDFHAAQELHKELNSAPVIKQYVPEESVRSDKQAKVYSVKKRGRPSKNAIKNEDKKLRSITSFFTSNK